IHGAALAKALTLCVLAATVHNYGLALCFCYQQAHSLPPKAKNCARLMGLKRTWVPMLNGELGWCSGLNNWVGQRPSKCQPPGLALGYTAVCSFAIATEPAGTRARGVPRRGSCKGAGSWPRKAKPGLKPIANT